MKSYLSHRSKRFGYDGWALVMPNSPIPLPWTVSTTRAEVRQLRKERGDLFERGARIVKVRVDVRRVGGE